MNNPPEHDQDDVIELRELIATLWGSKFLILTISTLFSIAGIAYALLAHQEWCSTALVAPPMPAQVKELRLRIENIKETLRLEDLNKADPKIDIRLDEFFTAFFEAKLFGDFLQAYNSNDNKYKFLESIGYAQEVDEKDANSRQRLFEEKAKKISASQKKNESFYTLSFTADTPLEARNNLKAYINSLQAKEVARKNELLNVEIANQVQSQVFKAQILKTDTLKRLNEEITRTELALRISKSAGVETPVENLNDQSVFPIDLGAKALSEKLKVLKEIKDPEIINPQLANIRLRLDALRAIPKETATFTAYQILQSPAKPLDRVKPKRSLVVVLATVAGLMVGIMTALFRSNLLSAAGGISQKKA